MSDGYKVYASQEYVDETINTLRIEIIGDLDEIGNLVGGETGDDE